jgi:hypothetical protein
VFGVLLLRSGDTGLAGEIGFAGKMPVRRVIRHGA